MIQSMFKNLITRKNKAKNISNLPLNENEINRKQIKAQLFKAIWGGNFSAPVENMLKSGIRVLEVRSGPGSWILDCCCDYKKSEFFGLDIMSKILPKSSHHNLQFVISDVREGLPFRDNTFDYVHVQYLTHEVKNSEWPKLLLELTRVLKVNGWLEISDSNYEIIRVGPYINRIINRMIADLTKSDIDCYIDNKFGRLLKDIGQLTNIKRFENTYPLGSWHGKLGEEALYISKPSWKVLLNTYRKELKIRTKDIDSVLESLVEECNHNRSYTTIFRWIAMKSHL